MFGRIIEFPGLSTMMLSSATGIVLTGIVLRNEINSYDDVLTSLGIAFLMPIALMVMAFPITILITCFLIFSYWFSHTRDEFYILRYIACGIAGAYWIILVVSTFDFPMGN